MSIVNCTKIMSGLPVLAKKIEPALALRSLIGSSHIVNIK